MINDVSFSTYHRLWKISMEKWESEGAFLKCENTYILPLSRARVRARSQEFLLFCCHKCHRIFVSGTNLGSYASFFLYFNRMVPFIPKNELRVFRKMVFWPLVFSIDYLLWRDKFHPWCDTCDSEKTISLLEGACLRLCVYACVYACVCASSWERVCLCEVEMVMQSRGHLDGAANKR